MNRASQQTSIEAVEKAALELLAVRGFDDTSAEEIAAAAGISRRTFFRYFGTKNNIPFGNYAALLREARGLALVAARRPAMFEVIVEAVVRFNRAHTDGLVAHRERMELIMHTPALRSERRAGQRGGRRSWRVCSSWLDEPADALGPQLVAHVAGSSGAAYEQWLRDESSDLVEVMQRASRWRRHCSTSRRGRRLRRRKRRSTSGR